jgi:hypothetical protein
MLKLGGNVPIFKTIYRRGVGETRPEGDYGAKNV